ncbi:hypothetical protein HPGCJGGD_2217 [Methylobacterium haplocladii]|nr:hypothetical protein HPGCJGGD_2217 [Methylobacterium haplocladii]
MGRPLALRVVRWQQSAMKIVSLGLFCLARRMIDAVGVPPERYPFDDAFTTLPIVNHCLEDNFADFLDFDRLLPCMNDNSWTPEVFRQRYNAGPVYAHHDMRTEENRSKFVRRSNRFLGLDASTLLVVMGDAPAILNGELQRLRANATRLFGDAKILAIAFGDGADWACDGVEIARVYPTAPTQDGLTFPNQADTDEVVGRIRDAAGRPRA